MMDFAASRRTMVENQLRTYDILDYNTLDVMGSVPRELFVPDAMSAMAYLDKAVPLGHERALMTPMVFGRLLQALDVQKTDRVLDIAVGSGYSSAVFAKLAAHVTVIENDEALAFEARANFNKLSIVNVALEQTSLNAGSSKQAPFDVIFINGSIEVEPTALLNQLADGGRLGVVMGAGRSGRAVIYRKNAENFTSTRVIDAAAISLMEFSKPKEFKF